MAVYKTPGVFIEELPKLPPSVASVNSAVPAFIGYTEIAKQDRDDDLLFATKKIKSFLEFELHFGVADPTHTYILYEALRSFFDNGGGECYIVSVGKFTTTINATTFLQGLDVVAGEDEPTLLVFPDAIKLPGLELYDVQRKALKQAFDLGDRFCILDLKYADSTATHEIVVDEFRINIGSEHLKNGSAYTPHIGVSYSSNLFLPPSAAIAGIYCTVDSNRGVWKAPANISVNQVTNLALNISNAEQEALNVDAANGKSINAIRPFPGRGILVWGARTLAGNDHEWRYVSVRRFFIMVEESVENATQRFVFEPNDANTWIQIRSMLENYFTELWKAGALSGAKTSQAFYVKVGLNETMTTLDILEGRMIIEFGLAVVRPAEFIIHRLMLKMFSE